MKTFLSIGTGPGMGIATADRFAKEGFRAVLSARNARKTQQLSDQLNSKGYKTDARTVDSGDPASIAALIVDVEREFGSIDVLHYNAASMRKATLAQQPRETLVSDLAVNIGGALVAAQAAASRMGERRSGTILLTGGGFALAPNADYLSLSIGKAGIRAMTLGLFEAFREKGIHIATVTVATFVSPGSKEADAVAEHFWNLHNQPIDAWSAEVNYGPSEV